MNAPKNAPASLPFSATAQAATAQAATAQATTAEAVASARVKKLPLCVAMAAPVTKIATFHPASVSSLVQSLPALVALRESFPGAKICSFARAPLVSFLQNFGAVDEVFARPGGDVSGQAALMARLRGGDYDIALSFSQSSNALLLTWATGAEIRAGFVPSRLESFLTHKVEKNGPFSAFCALELAKSVGAHGRGAAPLDFLGIPPEAAQKVQKWLDGAAIPSRFFVVAPSLPRRAPRPKLAVSKGQQSPLDHWNHAIFGAAQSWPCVLAAPEKWEFVAPPDAKPFFNASAKLDALLLAALVAKSSGVLGDESGALELARFFKKPLAQGDFSDVLEKSRHTFGL